MCNCGDLSAVVPNICQYWPVDMQQVVFYGEGKPFRIIKLSKKIIYDRNPVPFTCSVWRI